MSTQPKALRLADWLDGSSSGPMDARHKAAAELRRLYASHQELLASLKAIIGDQPVDRYGYFAARNAMDDDKREAARAAISRAEAI